MTGQSYPQQPAQPYPQAIPPSDATKPTMYLTRDELRKVIVSGVANGVLLAGLVLLVVNFAIGFVFGVLTSGR